jgi:hypothetical protein
MAIDELVGGERHYLVALATFEPVAHPLEGDALIIARPWKLEPSVI